MTIVRMTIVRMTILRITIVRIAAVLAFSPALAHAGTGEPLPRETLRSAGIEREYYLFVPDSIAATAPAPLLLLLHGSGSDGSYLFRAWKSLAERNGIVIAAPLATDRMHWHLRNDGPQFMYDLIEDVARRHSIDRRRVYLFGRSGGAVYALTLAMLESEYFAAAAISAGAWREKKEFRVLPIAARKIPVLLVVGDRDEFFPMKSVRATEAALRKAGHPVSVIVLPRHGHSYSEVATRINDEAWNFLGSVALQGAPRFLVYE